MMSLSPTGLLRQLRHPVRDAARMGSRPSSSHQGSSDQPTGLLSAQVRI